MQEFQVRARTYPAPMRALLPPKNKLTLRASPRPKVTRLTPRLRLPPRLHEQAFHTSNGEDWDRLTHVLNRRLQRTHKPFDMFVLPRGHVARGDYKPSPRQEEPQHGGDL